MNIGIIILAMTLIALLLILILTKLTRVVDLLMLNINKLDENHLLLRKTIVSNPNNSKDT